MPMRVYLNALEGRFWVEGTFTFPYRTQFIVELRCKKTSFQDELFLHNRHFKSCLVSIVSSTLPSCNGETKNPHQVRLHCLVDGTICKSVLSASHPGSNTQEHNVCRLSNHQASFILPVMPFNFIIVTADTYTHTQSVVLPHTLYDDGYFSAE